MKRIMLVSALLFFTLSSFGAKKSYLTFDTSLKSSHHSAYNTILLIDNRIDKSTLIGTSYNCGIHDLLTQASVAESITNFGNQLFRHQGSEEHTLLIILNGLGVSADENLTYLRIVANFYLGTNDKYHFLYAADTFIEQYTPKCTFKHAKDKALNESTIMSNIWLYYFEKASSLKTFSDTTVYNENTALNRYKILKQKIPVYNAKEYPTGVYRTREEFLNLTPSIKEFKRWDFGDGSVDRFSFKVDKDSQAGNDDGKRYYAVWTGKRWYKSAYPHPTQMHIKDGDFYFDILLTGIKSTSTSVLTMGALNYLANEIENNMIREKGKRVARRYRVKLDAETGKYIRVGRLDGY